MNAIEKYRLHQNTFHSYNEEYDSIFENLLNRCEDSTLECSLKIADDKVFSNRFNVWLNNFKDVLPDVFEFIRNIAQIDQVNINTTFLDNYFNNIDLNKVEKIIVGVDFRNQFSESRIKIWFVVSDYMKKIEEILLLHGYDDTVLKFITKKELLFGFDFFMNGRITAKVYPSIYKEELTDLKIKNKIDTVFNKKIQQIIQLCGMFYITFKGAEFERIIHFYPQNQKIDTFLRCINSDSLSHQVNTLTKTLNIKPLIYSFSEKELLKNNIKNFNIYY